MVNDIQTKPLCLGADGAVHPARIDGGVPPWRRGRREWLLPPPDHAALIVALLYAIFGKNARKNFEAAKRKNAVKKTGENRRELHQNERDNAKHPEITTKKKAHGVFRAPETVGKPSPPKGSEGKIV